MLGLRQQLQTHMNTAAADSLPCSAAATPLSSVRNTPAATAGCSLQKLQLLLVLSCCCCCCRQAVQARGQAALHLLTIDVIFTLFSTLLNCYFLHPLLLLLLLIRLSGPEGQAALHRLLSCFCLAAPQLGYCQVRISFTSFCCCLSSYVHIHALKQLAANSWQPGDLSWGGVISNCSSRDSSAWHALNLLCCFWLAVPQLGYCQVTCVVTTLPAQPRVAECAVNTCW
jgi:hypothetical protein